MAIEPGESLSRSYTPPQQRPTTPRNIIRRPLMVPGHGLPMEPVKDREETPWDRLREAVTSIDDEPEPPGASGETAQNMFEDVWKEPQKPVSGDPVPWCMACGEFLPDHVSNDPCPVCGGDVYDPAEP